MKKVIYLILFSLIFVSCKKELDISVANQDLNIVINGLIMPDSVAKVNVSSSLSILDNNLQAKFITDAKVDLYEGDIFLETLKYDTLGNYIGSIKLDYTKNYKIIASQSGFSKKASVNLSFKQKIVPTEITIATQYDSVKMPVYDSMGNSHDTSYLSLTNFIFNITINDPANDNNYYLLNFSKLFPVIKYNDYGMPDTVGYSYSGLSYIVLGIESSGSTNDVNDENITLPRISFDGSTTGAIINDVLFNGSTYTIKAQIDIYSLIYGNNYYYKNTIDTTTDSLIVYVNLYSVPKDVNNYAESYSKYLSNNGNPFSEPVNVFSNVVDGYGFVSTVNGTRFRLDLTQFLPEINQITRKIHKFF